MKKIICLFAVLAFYSCNPKKPQPEIGKQGRIDCAPVFETPSDVMGIW